MQNLNYKKNKYVYVLLYLAYISITIFTAYPATLSIRWNSDVDVFFIVFFVAFITCLLLLNWKDIKGIRIHYVTFLFVLRFLLYLINGLIKKVPSTYIVEELLITILYVVIFNCSFNLISEDRTEVKNLLTFFTIMTGVQLLLVYVVNDFSLRKQFIVAGIGYSNYCATFLLLAVSYLTFVKTNLFQKFVIGFGVIALILTESFGAYVAFLVVVVIALITKINWKSKKTILLFFPIIIVIVLGLIFFFNTKLGHPAWNRILTKFRYIKTGNYKNLGSSRISLYSQTLENIKNSPLFGCITNVITNSAGEVIVYKAHNFVLESLVSYGIVGTLINAIIVILVIIDIKKSKNKSATFRGEVIALIAVLIHGLVEPNFFTLHFEMFIAFIVGGMVNGASGKYSIALPLKKNKTEFTTER